MAKETKPKKFWIEPEFTHDEEVFVKTDPYQYPRQVIEIKLPRPDVIKYRVACGEEKAWFYGSELSSTMNPLIKQDDE